jgi:hypothetical protein
MPQHLYKWIAMTKTETFQLLKLIIVIVGPWVWKQVKIEEEKVKRELRGRHSDCHWVEVSKRAEKLERSVEKLAVG